jgi:hypothetical protein
MGMTTLRKASLNARELPTSAEAASFNVPQRRKQTRRGSVLDQGVVALLRNGETKSPYGNSLIETY